MTANDDQQLKKTIPFGYASLVWNPRTANLVVTLSVTGLIPGSIHAASIRGAIAPSRAWSSIHCAMCWRTGMATPSPLQPFPTWRRVFLPVAGISMCGTMMAWPAPIK